MRVGASSKNRRFAGVSKILGFCCVCTATAAFLPRALVHPRLGAGTGTRTAPALLWLLLAPVRIILLGDGALPASSKLVVGFIRTRVGDAENTDEVELAAVVVVLAVVVVVLADIANGLVVTTDLLLAPDLDTFMRFVINEASTAGGGTYCSRHGSKKNTRWR